MVFPPPTLDRNLGMAPHHLPHAPPTGAAPNGPSQVVDLLNEDLAAAGRRSLPVRSARTAGEAEVLDVVSIGASLRLSENF